MQSTPGSGLGSPVARVAAALCFALGLSALAFLAGYQVREWGVWPHPVLRDAKEALGALREARLKKNPSILDHRETRHGVTLSEPRAMAPGLTFISLWTEGGFLGRLIGAEGEVRHEWRIGFDAIWPGGAPQLRVPGRSELVRWHGVHLFPNGDLLVNFENDGFPYGSGLARIDRNSKLLWRLNRNTHHAVHVARDGTIWVPEIVPHPGETAADTWYYEDRILRLSPEGKVLDEISVLDALRGGLPGQLPARIETSDPTHLNDIELVTPELARAMPMLREGDIVVSLRNLSAIVAIDPATRLAHWGMRGSWVMQHDIDLLPNGRMMLFDNRGGNSPCGGSRLVEVDPATQAITWSYAACEPRFFSPVWGGQQSLANGNILITEAFGGRAFEITREAAPRVVWEYVNGLAEGAGAGKAGIIGEAQRIPPGQLTFLSP